MHPGKIVSTSQEVEVQVLEVDPVKRRISLGLKQTMRNPWEVFLEKYPAGSVVEGEVKNKTEFGLFLGLDGEVDGMVHLSDLDWKRPGEQVIEEYKKGDKVNAQVLDVDVEKERISLGIKQLTGGAAEAGAAAGAPAEAGAAGELKKGVVVTCEVMDVKEGGIDVKIVGTDFSSFIKRSELARDRSEQRPDRFAAGQKVDARVIQFDRRTHKIRSRSRRWKSPRRRRRSRNTAPPIPARRSAISWAPRSSARARRTRRTTTRKRRPRRSDVGPSFRARRFAASRNDQSGAGPTKEPTLCRLMPT